MRWAVAMTAAAAAGVGGCGGQHAAGQAVDVSNARAGVAPVATAGGCGATTVRRGRVPVWTGGAFSASSSPRPFSIYAVSAHGTVAAILGVVLRAGHPTNPANKILWIMRLPRAGSDLHIRATPLHAAAPVVTVTRTADSSPGEIYPSYVDVPIAGCWRLTLRWATHQDTIDLAYAT